MVVSPLLIRHNGRIADLLFPRDTAGAERATSASSRRTRETAQRDHVIVCGFGRVGQNLARVLEREGFEYIALDMDPRRVQAARGRPAIRSSSAMARRPRSWKPSGSNIAACWC